MMLLHQVFNQFKIFLIIVGAFDNERFIYRKLIFFERLYISFQSFTTDGKTFAYTEMCDLLTASFDQMFGGQVTAFQIIGSYFDGVEIIYHAIEENNG